MRVSDSIKFRNVIQNLQTGQRSLAATQAQISSGKRILKPSEDPNAAAVIMQTRAAVRGVEQYQRNIGVAIARVETEEVVLNQLNDALGRALELAVSQAGDTANDTTRTQVRYEMENLLRFVVSLGNTRHGEGFLFAGHATDQMPFDPEAPLPPRIADDLLKQPHEVEIAMGVRVPTNHNGDEVFVSSGAIKAVQDFVAALRETDPAEAGSRIRESIDTLKGATVKVQDLLGDVGGRYNHLQTTERRLELLHLSSVTLRSQLEDVDMAKAMVDLVTRQTALQSAMMATSRVINLTLTDYLR
jgi:flagellar hook-associated protein 3 FlgL